MLAYVTGAAGFLGSHLCDRLLDARWDVVGIDNYATGRDDNLARARTNPRFTMIRADVAQPWTTWSEAAGTPGPPTHLFHLASPASPRHYERLALETLAVNAVGTMHATHAALQHGAALLYASTSETYGDPLEHPQRERYWGNVNPIGVRACYDEAKRYGEAYVATAVRKRGVDGRIARIFNTYGPRMQRDDGRVIPSFCASALRGEPLAVYGNGLQTRSFCYVDDLIDGIVRLATLPGLGGSVVNLGNPDEHTIRQLAEMIAGIAGVPLRTVHEPLPPDDPARRRPDITLAQTLLHWNPAIALADGLRRTLDDFRTQPR